MEIWSVFSLHFFKEYGIMKNRSVWVKLAGPDTRVYFVQKHVGHSKACFKLRGVLWLYDKALPAGLRNVMYKEHRWYRNLNRNGKTRIFI